MGECLKMYHLEMPLASLQSAVLEPPYLAIKFLNNNQQ